MKSQSLKMLPVMKLGTKVIHTLSGGKKGLFNFLAVNSSNICISGKNDDSCV